MEDVARSEPVELMVEAEHILVTGDPASLTGRATDSKERLPT